MLEDFRDDSDFVEENDPGSESQGSAGAASTQTRFLGMTPIQRFVIAIMILLSVCILGLFFLLITGNVVFPV